MQRLENLLLCGILVFTPVLFCNRMNYNFHTPKYLFLQLSVFAILALILFYKEIRVRINSLDGLIILRLLWFIPLAFLTKRYTNLFRNVDIFAYLILLYILIQIILIKRDKPDIEKFIQSAALFISAVGILEAVYGISQYYHLDVFHPGGYQSYESLVIGTLGSANSMGCFLAACLPFTIYTCFIQSGKFKKSLIGVGIGLIVWALILTISRAAWIALIAGLLFLSSPKLSKWWQKLTIRKTAKIIIITIILLSAALAFIGIFYINADSAMGRIFIWKISWDVFRDYPLLGVGYGNYAYHYLDYQAKFFNNPRNAEFYGKAANLKLAHSEFFHILAETGLVGFILFWALLVFVLYSSWKLLHNNNGLLIRSYIAAFLIISVHALFDSVLHTLPIALLFYFSIAIISLLTKQSHIQNSKLTRSIGFEIKTNRVFPVIGIGLLAFNSYRIIDKSLGYVYWKKGQIEVRQDNWEQGIQEYRQALRHLPDNAELKFHLGAAYTYTGQSQTALPLLRQSLTEFTDKNSYIVLGICYLQIGEYSQAEANFKKVTEMFPDHLYPHFLLAQLYHHSGHLSRSISELQFIIEYDPKITSEDVRAIKRDAHRFLATIISQQK